MAAPRIPPIHGLLSFEALARLRSAGFKFCWPGFNAVPPAPGSALTPANALTDACAGPGRRRYDGW